MLPRACVALLALGAAACGARSDLPAPPSASADCAPLSIGILGNPGAYSNAFDFDEWLVGSGAAVERLHTVPEESLTAETLQPFDVVVLDWLTRDYTPAEADTFAAWVAAGGGVVAMSGYDNKTFDDWHANSLLAPLGVAYAGPLISGPVSDFAGHPITDGLTSVVFEGGYAIDDLGSAGSSRTPIAFLPGEGGDVNVGYAIQMGAGRAFVWGDEWIEFLSKGPDFPPQLWVQGFGWAAPVGRCALVPPS